MVVYMVVCEHPAITFADLLALLRSVPRLEGMSPSWLSRTTQSWEWDWKKVQLIARNKYSPQNKQDWISYALHSDEHGKWKCVYVFASDVVVQLVFVDESKGYVKKAKKSRVCFSQSAGVTAASGLQGIG